MKGVLLTIVGLVIGLILIVNPLPDVINDVITEDYAEPFDVTTGANTTTTTENLGYDHYYGDLRDLTAESDNEDDDPVVFSYDEDTRDTVVGGLQALDTRILTINYVRETRQEFTGFAAFVRILPFFMVIGLIVAGLWNLFSRMGQHG